jgi:hypothetical protein
MNYLLRIGIFLSLWLLLMIGGRSNFFRDPGTFSHLAIGERILSTHHFIYSDPFSFTFKGKPWIAQQWLGECFMAVVNRIGGFDGLLLMTVTLLASLFALLSYRLMDKGMHPVLAILVITIAMAASSRHFHVRPHIVTIVFMAFLFALLTDFESGEISFSKLFWLIPFFALWVNIHGGVLGGMATMALIITGWIFLRVFKKSPPIMNFHQGLQLVFLFAVCSSTILFNPYSFSLPKTWFSIMNSPALPKMIQEHAPLFSFPVGTYLSVLPIEIIYLICLLGTVPGTIRVSWLIPLVWLVLSWMRVRHTPLFAVSAAISIGEMFPYIRWVKWLLERGSNIFKIQTPTNFGRSKHLYKGLIIVPILLLTVGLIAQKVNWSIPLLGSNWAKIDSTYWPVDDLPNLIQIQKDNPEEAPIFNEFQFGGFLMYYTPEIRVFIDDRCELYGDDFLRKYFEAENNNSYEKFNSWVKQYGFGYALTERNSGFDKQFSRSIEWSVISKSKASIFYKRKLSEN